MDVLPRPVRLIGAALAVALTASLTLGPPASAAADQAGAADPQVATTQTSEGATDSQPNPAPTPEPTATPTPAPAGEQAPAPAAEDEENVPQAPAEDQSGEPTAKHTATELDGDDAESDEDRASAALAPMALENIDGPSLTWGVKQSFRNYITSPIAQGEITVGEDTAWLESGEFEFGQSSSSLDETFTGTASYAGSVHFSGHGDILDVTLADPQIDVLDDAAAELTVQFGDERIVLADVDLDAATRTDDASTVTWAGAPTVITAEGEQVFSYMGSPFYAEGTALDPLTFTANWEGAEVEYGVTVSPTADMADGDTVTVTGSLPATLDGQSTAIYLMFCVEGDGEVGTAAGRLSGDACDADVQEFLSPVALYGGVVPATGTVTDGVWEFEQEMQLPASVGDVECAEAGDAGSDQAQCGIFVRLYHGFNAGNTADPYAFDEFIPVNFAEEPTFGLTSVTPTEGLTAGDTVSVTASYPAVIDGQATGVYVMVCAEGDGEVGTAEGRLTGSDCDATVQQYLSSVPLYGGVVPATGTVTDGVWNFETGVQVPASFGAYECAEAGDAGSDQAQCGIFVRLAHGFTADNTADPYVYDEFVPLTFAAPATPEGDLTWGVKKSFVDYVESGVAAGVITVSNGATRSGDEFGFGLTSSTINTSYVGTASYKGAVNFYGHGGDLDVTFADPRISVRNASTAYLSANVDGERVTIAKLNLTDAEREARAGVVTWTGASAALTEDGTAVFAYQGNGFYEAGAALDPVTFQATYAADNTGGNGGGTGGGTGNGNGGNGNGGSGGDGGTVGNGGSSGSDVAVGSLRWGVKSSFRSYITGPIANGGYTASSGATFSGGQFVFVQDGGDADAGSRTGTATFDGAVRFSGHGGLLDLTMADPAVRFTGNSSAALVMTVNGSRTTVATLNLGAGARSAQDGAVTYRGVPATLTGSGASAFSYNGSGFYAAGTAMDPVTVTFGAEATATPTSSQSFGGSSARGSSAGALEAGEYGALDIDSDTLERLLAGDVVTIGASGFAPGESVQVVLFSDPIVLATLTADANGDVSWTGALPASVSGEHELVFIGMDSDTRLGLALDIPERTAAGGMCLAEGGELTWALKDSFLSYIDSAIANGTWEVDGGVEDLGSTFVWPFSTGAIDPQLAVGSVEFGGSVRFTGHDGVLDTTVANPTLEFSGDGAYLLVDIVSTTQEGAEVDATQVRFAELDLDAGTVTGADGEVLMEDVPAVLTAAGADAFGTYPEGDELAPVSATLTGDDCLLALAGEEIAVDEPTDEPSAEPAPQAGDEGDLAADAGEGGASSALWWALGLVAAAALLGAGFLLGRRRTA